MSYNVLQVRNICFNGLKKVPACRSIEFIEIGKLGCQQIRNRMIII